MKSSKVERIDIKKYLKEKNPNFIAEPQSCPVCKINTVYGNYWCEDCRNNICVNCKKKPRVKNNLYVARCEDCSKLCYTCNKPLEPEATNINCSRCWVGFYEKWDRCSQDGCNGIVLSDGFCLLCGFDHECFGEDFISYDTVNESNNYHNSDHVDLGCGGRWKRSTLNIDD